MRKIIGMALICLLATTATAGLHTAYASMYEQARITVVYNGNALHFNPPPVVRNGYVFFPIEDLLAGIGVNHGWDAARFVVIGSLNGNVLEIPLNDLSYIINGIRLNVSGELLPFVDNERTYVYLDYIVQGFGIAVEWDGMTSTITMLIPVESVSLKQQAAVSINKGERLALEPEIYPANASNTGFIYHSSNESVATVSGTGEIRAVDAGTATITCVTSNGKSAECTVTVIVPVAGVYIEMDRSSSRYKTGETALFNVIITPEDATDTSVTLGVDGAGAELTGNNSIIGRNSGIVTVSAAASNGVTGVKEVTIIDLVESAAEVVRFTNIERQNQGLSSLSTNDTLTRAAVKRAEEIIASFSHDRPDGRSFSTVLPEFGISYNTAGENISYGRIYPEAQVEGWMNSPGHRANILNNRFTNIGVGVAMDGKGVLYWVQIFTGGR